MVEWRDLPLSSRALVLRFLNGMSEFNAMSETTFLDYNLKLDHFLILVINDKQFCMQL